MPLHQHLSLVGLRQRAGFKSLLLRHVSTSKSGSVSLWLNNSTLPGGFSADGLREWATITDFGADGNEQYQSRQDIRRRRLLPERYADIFSKRVSEDCSSYLAGHPSPSNVLGRAFFGSRSFMSERLLLSSLNSVFRMYPKDSTILPVRFNINDQYLQWKVSFKAPLEIIYTYRIDRFHFRGCTMLAYDPSLNKIYHGNCIDVAQEKVQSSLGIRMHVQYAKYLLDGMASELEMLASDARKF